MASPDATKANLENIDKNVEQVTKVWNAFMGSTLTAREAGIAKAFQEARARYLDGVVKPAMAAMRTNNLETLRAILVEKDAATYADVCKNIVDLTDLQLTVGKEEYNAAQDRYTTVRSVSLTAMMLGLALAALFGWTIVRGITRSLSMAMHTTDAVAAGDLTTKIVLEGKDETTRARPMCWPRPPRAWRSRAARWCRKWSTP
ncbi:Tar ligand binding domain-containing protein [Rugamonas apoptosis]